MKKILLASAALALTGGGALADISISGSANFGLKYDDGSVSTHHEFDITFSASGMTDGGLEFGASTSIDNNESTTADYKPGSDGEFTAADNEISVRNYGIENSVKSEDGSYYTYTDVDGDEHTVSAANYAKFMDDADEACDVPDGTKLSTFFDKATIPELVDFLDTGELSKTITVSLTTDDIDEDVDATCTLKHVPASYTAGSDGTYTKGHVSNNASVYVSGEFGKLTIGEGLDAGDVVGGIADVGFDGLGVDDVAEGLRGDTSAPIRYEGTFSMATVSLTSDLEDDWAVGLKFAADPVKVLVGLASDDAMSAGLGYSAGGMSGNAFYSERNGMTAYGMDLGYTVDGNMDVTAAYAKNDSTDAVGLGVSYSLGGGATLGAGIAQIGEGTKADVGISMSF